MQITTTPPFATNTPQAVDRTNISADFDTFLKMLTAQIQNQDPLNPIDSADYAVQLATFSSVEQQTLTNQKLDNLAGLMNVQGMAQLASWVGQEARSTSPIYVEGRPVTLSPNPQVGADRAVLVVQDADGNTVSREDVSTNSTTHIWNGTDITGNPLPHGVYTLSLESYNQGVQIGSGPVESYSRIQEVQISPTGPMLILAGGISLSSDQITALRSPI